MTFVVSSERDRGEIHRPHTIIDFLEGDVFAGERRRDEERLVAPGHAAVAADQADFHVTGIRDCRHARGQRAWRRRVATRGRLVVQRLVRPLVVVLADESAKALLLGRAVGRRRPRGFRFQDRVKLFVRPVLFRMPWRNPLRDDAQAHPPHAELRQSAQAWAREGAAVIAANPLWQSILAKGPAETVACRLGAAAQKSITPQDEATATIAQRQRIAIPAVTGAEFAFEIRRPDLVHGRDRRHRRARGVRGSRAPRARHDQAARAEKRTDGRTTRPVDAGVAPSRDREQLLRAPVRMAPTVRHEHLHQVRIRRVRTLLRPPRSILQAGGAGGGVAFEPLVPVFRLIPYCAASSVIVNSSVSYSRTKSRRCSMGDVSRHGIEAPPAMQEPRPCGE